MSKQVETNAGLLIVDVQKGFINGATEHIPGIVEQLQNHYKSVAASKFVNQPFSPHRTIMNWHRFSPESEDIELAFSASDHVYIFDKPQYTCVSYELLRWVRLNKLDEIHLCGIDTDVCVLTSATALFEISIRPVVLSWACASHGGEASHNAGLLALSRIIGSDNIRGENEVNRSVGNTDRAVSP